MSYHPLSNAYRKFQAHRLRLTSTEAIAVHCYLCNGQTEGAGSCRGAECALYQFFPYRAEKKEGTENG